MEKNSRRVTINHDGKNPCNRIKWGNLHDSLTAEARDTKLYKFLNEKMLLKKWIKNYMKSQFLFSEGLNAHFEDEGNYTKSFSNVFLFHESKQGWEFWNEHQKSFVSYCDSFKIKLIVKNNDESNTNVELEFNIIDIGDKYRFDLIDLCDETSKQSFAGIIDEKEFSKRLTPLCRKMVRYIMKNEDNQDLDVSIKCLVLKYEWYEI